MLQKNTPFRGCCITAYKIEGWSELPEGIQFLAWGDEVCKTTGRPHKQAFAYSKRAQRDSWWRKKFSPHHVEQMFGSFTANEAYCSKEASYHKLGEPPMANGLHYGMQLCKRKAEAILPGETAMDIAEDPECFAEVMRYDRAIERYISHVRHKKIKRDLTPPEVIHIYGPPGTGKTRYVWDHEESPFGVPNAHGPWRDGYAMHEAVLFDNVESGRITDRSEFLKQIDRYPIQVPVKGGFTAWKPRRIYITSIQTPAQFASAFENPQEFLRRVTQTIHLPGI